MRHGFPHLAKAVIDFRPTLTELVLRFDNVQTKYQTHETNHLANQATPTLLRALPDLQHLALYCEDAAFEARDVVEPVLFHLVTLDLDGIHEIPIGDNVLSFLTSASTASLVSVTLRSVSDGDGPHNLRPLFNLISLHLKLPNFRERNARAPDLGLKAFRSQLHAVPPSVRRLTLEDTSQQYKTCASSFLPHNPATINHVTLVGFRIYSADVVTFFDRAPALEWKVFQIRPVLWAVPGRL